MRRASMWGHAAYIDLIVLAEMTLMLGAFRFLGGIPQIMLLAYAPLFMSLAFHLAYRLSKVRGRGWFWRFDDAFFRNWNRRHPDGPGAIPPRFCARCHQTLSPDPVYCAQCGRGPYERPEGMGERPLIAWRGVPFESLCDAPKLVVYLAAYLALLRMAAGVRQPAVKDVLLWALMAVLIPVAVLDALHHLAYALDKGWFVRWDERLPWGWARQLRKRASGPPCAACGGDTQAERRYCPHCGAESADESTQK